MNAKVEGDHVEVLRLWILGVLLLGLLGTVTELMLLSHYEQPLQLVPVVLIALAIVSLLWQWLMRDMASLNVMLVVMALSVVAGFVGVLAHFEGSAEFQRDLDPSMGTWELLEKILRAKAPPLLAPGMMIQLGLLGLAYGLSDARYRERAKRLFAFARQKEQVQ
jgi:hypothetical protein